MKYWNKFSVVLVVVILFFILTMYFLFNSKVFNTTPDNEIYNLSEGWTITASGSTYENIVLSDADIGVQNYDDIVTLSTTMPSITVPSPVIYFASALSEVDVYLDDALIYEFGDDYLLRFGFVPKIYNVVVLPDDYQGKELFIKLTSKDEVAFSGLSSVLFGNRHDIFISSIQSLRLPIFSGIFLIVFACILFILSPYVYIFNGKDLKITLCGLISLDLGLYILAYNKIFYLFSDLLFLNTLLEFFSLYFMPSTILLYLSRIFTGRNRLVFNLLLAVNTIFTITVLVLGFTNIVPITRYTSILHALVFVEMPVSVFLILRDILSKKKDEFTFQSYTAENIFLIGLLVFMIFSMIDIVKFNIYKYMSSAGEVSASIDFMTIGSLTLIICVLLNYFFYTVNNMNAEVERMHLVGLAYTDALSGLANRARCEQVMDDLSAENKDYSIISMDMDYLKKVNDTYGHEEGDRLIIGFATILNQVFWDAALIGRMGGDEFIVISKDPSAKTWSKKLNDLNNTISEWNKKEHKFKYSASVGFASSSEAPGHSAMDVYMLADNRMYSMKNERHRQREEASGND
ncbi:MAG: GGDEF domain-containing protein [Butyrivibrio sp.]|nr:GGDEF domain-containing protein [Butyrivibrio sp.]